MPLKICPRPPPVPEPTPSAVNEIAKTTASTRKTHFCRRRSRMKKRSWLGLPPEACLRCFRAGFVAAAACACCACFAFTAALAISGSPGDVATSLAREARSREALQPPGVWMTFAGGPLRAQGSRARTELPASPLEEHSQPDRPLEQHPHRQELEERRHEIGPGQRER